MSTPLHLSGARPSAATSAASRPSLQSVTQNQGGAQAAMFDLLFALQLGAGGWEAARADMAAMTEGDASSPDPATITQAPELPITAAAPDAATADPAALLWNPFSERATPVYPSTGDDAGDAEEAPISAPGITREKDGKCPTARPALTGTLTGTEDAVPKDAPVPREYSQVHAAAREPDQAAKADAAPAPQTVQQGTPSPTPAAVARLDAPMGTPAFREQLTTQIAVFIDQKQLSAQIQVHPPELGPVDVQIKLNAEQVEVGFFATQGDARDAIENAIPRLREMLAEQGLSLGSAHVGTREDPRAFASAFGGNLSDGGEGAERGGARQHGTDRDSSADSDSPAPLPVRQSLRLVDTFV